MDSQASSTLIGQHMLDAFKLMPCSTHFFQPPHLGLLPGLAAHFCFLHFDPPNPSFSDSDLSLQHVFLFEAHLPERS